MRVEIVPCLKDNYAYLLVGDTGQTVVIDPSAAEPVTERVAREGLDLVGIWCTHHHLDHVGGVEALTLGRPDRYVVGSAYDAEHARILGQTRGLGQDEPLWFASRRTHVLRVPGHTLGALAFFIGGALFSGDTLFGGGCGRLFEGTPHMMQRSLDKLRALPEDTRLYCGHEYTVQNLEFAVTIEPDNAALVERLAQARALRSQALPTVPSTLGLELATNPFLRWDEPVVIAKARELGATSEEPDEVFAAIRRTKDSF